MGWGWGTGWGGGAHVDVDLGIMKMFQSSIGIRCLLEDVALEDGVGAGVLMLMRMCIDDVWDVYLKMS